MVHETHDAYQCSLPFDEVRINAAAVYCSDGRFGEHFDEFLQTRLALPKYDRLAVPGGAASLAGHFATHREGDAMVEELRFLIEVHQLRRVVLVAHQDCAFYTRRLEVSTLGLAEMQIEDLHKAASRVRELAHSVAVDAWFAHRHDDLVTFEPIPV